MPSRDCRLFTEKILTYLEHPAQYQADLEAALDHFSQCPECQLHANFLIQALATGRDDSFADLAVLAYGEEGLEPPDSISPNLSFLAQEKTPSPSPTPWHWTDMGGLVIEFSKAVVASFQPPGYAPAGLKKPTQGPRTLGEFTLKRVDTGGVGVKISAKEKRNEPARCAVTVHVDVEGRQWPHLKGSNVAVKRHETLLKTGLTDKFGNVIFEIDCADWPRLTFEIVPVG